MSHRKPHLFMIGPVPPPHGGVGRIFQSILESEIQERYEITVVDTSKKDAREIVSDSSVSLRDGAYFLRTLAVLVAKLAGRRPDLAFLTPVADHSLVREALFLRLVRLAGAGVVCQFHARYEGELFVSGPRWARRLLGPMLRPADRILLLSDGLRRHFAADFPSPKTGVLPNFVDTGELGHLPVPRPAHDPLTVFFLGRLSEAKGVWDLLHAVQPVIAVTPETRFVLGGMAEFVEIEREIRAFLTDRGLDPVVSLPGTLTGEAKIGAFAAADLFCLPTHLDNQPVVLLEAMAAGLPIVTTSVGAIPEMIGDGEEGIVVPPRSPERLAAAILRLLSNPELRARMGAAGRARVRRDFDRALVIDRLIGELEEVRESRRRPNGHTPAAHPTVQAKGGAP